jgi:hypothetical protein
MGGHFIFLGNLYTFHKGPPFVFHTHNRSLHIVRPLNRGKISTLPLVIALGKMVWLLDCWSMNKGCDFLDWMKETHPNILVIFIPTNYTSVF